MHARGGWVECGLTLGARMPAMLVLQPRQAFSLGGAVVVGMLTQVRKRQLQAVDGVAEHAEARVTGTAESAPADAARMMMVLHEGSVTLTDRAQHFRPPTFAPYAPR